MPFKENSGTNELAKVLSGRMKQEGETPLFLDFGTINGNYSLTTNTFPMQIPKGQYSICRGLIMGTAGSEMAGSEGMKVPENMCSLMPGDRVLVGWVFNEAVVIDIILSSANL